MGEMDMVVVVVVVVLLGIGVCVVRSIIGHNQASWHGHTIDAHVNSGYDDRSRHAPCDRCNSNPATCVSFVAFTTVRLSVYERPGRP